MCHTKSTPMASAKMEEDLIISRDTNVKIIKWKVRPGSQIYRGNVLAVYEIEGDTSVLKFKATDVGTVVKLCVEEDGIAQAGQAVLKMEGCKHSTVMKKMCAECGADLSQQIEERNKATKESVSASVAMVHSVPELIVSEQLAKELGRADENRLLKNRKLVLLVDLDQTLIHTTNDNIPPNLKDVYHFQLPHGHRQTWFHTKFRPHTKEFLQKMSQLYELHICTFGVRLYAHTIARFLDPEGKYFSHRILSRDEFFNPTSKTANLKALFPCGDSMACIIDDREDVWNFAPNLVHVKPYLFFEGTADINAPPGLNKGDKESDESKTSCRVVKVHKVKKNRNGHQYNESVGQKDDTNKTTPEVQNTDNTKGENTLVEKEEEKADALAPEEPKAVDEKDVNGTENNDSEESSAILQPETGENKEAPLDEKTSNVNKEDSESTADKPVEQDVAMETDQGDSEKVVDQKEEKPREPCCDGSGDQAAEAQTEEKTSSAKHAQEQGDGAQQSAPQEDQAKTEKQEEVKKSQSDDEEGEYEEMIEWGDNDDYLHYLEDILKKIHSAFYEVYDQLQTKTAKDKDLPDLKSIIPYVRKKVLKGANIMFSGVFPTNQAAEKSRAYLTAKSLGATVQSVFVPPGEPDATTHLVAAKLGTAKVNSVRKHKAVHVLTPEWLWSCAERWEWVDERLFPLNEVTQSLHGGGSPDPQQMSRKRKRDENSSPKYNNNNNPSNKSDSKAESSQSQSTAQPSTSSTTAPASRKIEQRRFSETVSPMYALSKADWDSMDQEVQDLLDSDESDSDSASESEADSDNSWEKGRELVLRKQVLGQTPPESSSEESMSGDFPLGWKRKKRKRDDDADDNNGDNADTEEQPLMSLIENPDKLGVFSEQSSDSDRDDDDFNDSVGSADEEMAAALEKEFLS